MGGGVGGGEGSGSGSGSMGSFVLSRGFGHGGTTWVTDTVGESKLTGKLTCTLMLLLRATIDAGYITLLVITSTISY